MFGIDGGEFLVIAVVALVVIGPKDLPRVMRMVGQWVGKARAMSRHVRSGFDTMMREAELEEMQKQWDAQNAAIITSTTGPLMTPLSDYMVPPPALPDPAPPAGDAAEPELPLVTDPQELPLTAADRVP